MTLYTQQAKNVRKTWFFLTMFFILVIIIGYVFAQALGNSWILYGAVIFATGMSFWSYWFSDKAVLKMTGAKEIDRKNFKELYNIVENLVITAGLPMPRVFVMDDMALNAFATGRNPEHAVIVFTRGLLERLDKEEIRGVAAHELSHIGNNDMFISTIAVILTGFVTIVADWFTHFAIFGSSENRNPVMMIVAIGLALLAPFFAIILRMTISRKREFLADASGALLTRYPEGLASALEKISADQRPVTKVNKATANLFIANPFKGKKVMKWFQTHPPVEERIAALRAMDIG